MYCQYCCSALQHAAMHSHTAIQPGARLAGWKFENHGWDFTVGSTVGARLGSAGNLRLGCRLGPVGGPVGISRLGPSVGPGWDGWPVGPVEICWLKCGEPNREIPTESQPRNSNRANRDARFRWYLQFQQLSCGVTACIQWP